MKVEVTSLKAPWPPGAKLGDVVDIEGDAVPAWLVGKCKPAEAQPAKFEAAPVAPPPTPAKSKR